ncbi:MAG: hypothetical protein WC374_07555 [Phycisphaerae bacterium]|jgi:hypothetical protein
MKKIYWEEDELGRHKVIEQANGIKIKLLKEPSEFYKDKMKKRADADAIKRAEQATAKERERLVQAKMRELAEAELKTEGKI